MVDLSMITFCGDNSVNIAKYMINIIRTFQSKVKYEILIVNNSKSEEILSLLSSCEEKFPESIIIINADYTSGEEAFEIAMNYMSGECFLLLDSNEPLAEDSFRRILFNEETCDEDKAKFIKDKFVYIMQAKDSEQFAYNSDFDYPWLQDYRNEAGSLAMDYFLQDIYVAKKIHELGYKHIFDIGSRLDGYISHLLAMDIKVTMIDIRPLSHYIHNLEFIQGDATDLSNIESNSIPFLTCLHALEHFGLGRYNDPVDYNGWKKALLNYARVIEKNGYLIVSTPIGFYEVVMFNAHRIFDPETIPNFLEGKLQLCEFTAITKENVLSYDFESGKNDREFTFQEVRGYIDAYDCGIYVFKKVK